MQALTTNIDLTLVKDGQDFVQSFGVSSQVEEGFVQVVDVNADGATVDLSNFTTVEQIVVHNRDQLTLCHAEYTYVQSTLEFAANALSFASGTPDQIDVLAGSTTFSGVGVAAGHYLRVSGSTSNDGTYLVSRIVGEVVDVPDSVTLTPISPEPLEVTIEQQRRNRAPIGPGESHLVAGSGLYLPDQLVLRTRHLQPQVTCEVWVFGT